MKKIFRIEGMVCEHCAAAVKGAISAVSGVDSVSVDLAGKRAEVECDDAAVAAILAAIEEAGFEGKTAE